MNIPAAELADPDFCWLYYRGSTEDKIRPSGDEKRLGVDHCDVITLHCKA